jgi:hypothetical protein
VDGGRDGPDVSRLKKRMQFEVCGPCGNLYIKWFGASAMQLLEDGKLGEIEVQVHRSTSCAHYRETVLLTGDGKLFSPVTPIPDVSIDY